MPVIHVFHRDGVENPAPILQKLCEDVSVATDIPPDKVWAIWHALDPSMVWRLDWNDAADSGPIVRIFCRRSHSRPRVESLVTALRTSLAATLGCRQSKIFVQVIRIDDEEVFNVN